MKARRRDTESTSSEEGSGKKQHQEGHRVRTWMRGEMRREGLYKKGRGRGKEGKAFGGRKRVEIREVGRRRVWSERLGMNNTNQGKIWIASEQRPFNYLRFL